MKYFLGLTLLTSLTGAVAAPKITYLMKTLGSEVICIDSDAEAESFYGSFRFFLDDGTHKGQIVVLDVKRMRDGGTTYVTLASGAVFFSPSVFKKELRPTYNGEELTKIPFDLNTTKSCQDL